MTQPIEYDPEVIVKRYSLGEKLGRYFDLLLAENAKVNLVSRETDNAGLTRMAAESLLPLEHLPENVNGYLDIGAGGGFPSVPILLTGLVQGEAFLLERTGKKARALTSIIKSLELSAQVQPVNFEEAKFGREFGLVTLRYVKLTPALLDKITAKLAPGGIFVYYSTPEFHVKRQKHVIHTIHSSQDEVNKSFTVFGN